MGIALGRPVASCEIRPGGRSGQQTNDEGFRWVHTVSIEARHGLQDEICVLMAGRVGENVYWDDSGHGRPAGNDTDRDDIQQAFYLAREIAMNEGVSEVINHQRERAIEIFEDDDNRKMLTAVAKRLFVKSKLSRDEIDEICNRFATDPAPDLALPPE